MNNFVGDVCFKLAINYNRQLIVKMQISVLLLNPKSLSSVFIIFALLHTTASLAATIDPASLYQNHCSVCHGDQGNGKSHAKQGLIPPPRDFTSSKSAMELSQQRIRHSIRNGIPGTAMVAWKSKLSNQQITALANYIRDTFLRVTTVKRVTAGARIYADFCSVCHGDTGKGAVWATAGLRPPPIDFTDIKKHPMLTRPRMLKSVAFGRAETAMTAWKNRLTDIQIEQVVDYVITTFMPSSALQQKKTSVNSTRADMTLALPNNLIGNYQRGAALYSANCTACHGNNGDGRGPRAYFINPKPRNFLHPASRANFNRPTLYLAIQKGKLRTEMPAWQTVLKPQQLADVSEYVFKQFIRQH